MGDNISDFSNTLKARIDSDIKRAFTQAAPILESNTKRTFDEGGARDNLPKWAIRSNPTPLIRSGKLRAGMKGAYDKDNSRNAHRIVISNDVPYGPQHNEGQGQIKREYMIFAEEDFFRVFDLLKRNIG